MELKHGINRSFIFFLFCFLMTALPTQAETGKVQKSIALPHGVHYQIVDKTPGDGKNQNGELFFRTSIDGGKTYGQLKKQELFIKLRNTSFDPLNESDKTRGLVPGPQALTAGDTFLVQLETQPLSEFERQIGLLGGKVVAFVPPQTYVVRINRKSTGAIAKLPFVRWIGPYMPAHKTTSVLWERLQTGGIAADQPRRYIISLFSKDDVGPVVTLVKTIGGSIVVQSSVKSSFIQAELTGNQLLLVIKHENVQFVEPWTQPEHDMNIVRQVGGADFLESQVPFYTGQGVSGEILDDGVWATHQGFAPPQLHGGHSNINDHGTSVYGIVFGTGNVNPLARGMLPDANGILASYLLLSDRATHTAELVDPNGTFRAVFQSNSWGNSQTTAYNSFSAEMDQIIFDSDILITQSQSNTGNRNSRPQAWAKNIVAVGGIRHFDTADLGDDAWNLSASIGPAADGRIKPDLSHFYDFVLTTAAGSDTSHTAFFGGTSAATPITAGHFGLMFQMWADGIFTGNGIPGSGSDVFDARPHASTAKALVINTAQQYPFAGQEHDLTRVHQGWGLANVETLYLSAELNDWQLPLVVNEEHLLQEQQTRSYTVRVTDGGDLPWLKATMVYTDPAGNPAAAIATVNDLSLRLTSPDGTVYWGNVGLLEGNWSVSGGSSNPVDTVENVFIENAESGDWTLNVIADRIVQDSHLETASLDADYALVVTCEGQNRCALQTGNESPSVVIVSPANGETFAAGEDITITAEADDVDGTVVEVEFFVNDMSIGVDTAEPYSVTLSNATAGTLEITAVATDDDGASTVSAPVSVVVGSGGEACRYIVIDEWENGFTATIRITNTGTATVNTWDARWEYSDGSFLHGSWNAQISGSNPYTAIPYSWNNVLQPGQSVEFGLSGAKGITGSPAQVPSVTGSLCE